MTTTLFNDSELSNYSGRPVQLYKFSRGTITYLYAQSDRDVTIGNHTYTAQNISDDGVALTGNATQDIITIHIPSATAIVQAYAGTAPSQTITLTILRYHPGDADAIVNYVGQVMAVSQKSPGMSQIDCVSLSGTFKRDGLRIAWERSCPYALYDMNCKVDPSNYTTYGLVTGLFDGILTFPSAATQPDGFWNGGYVEWNIGADGKISDNGTTVERRVIQIHFGTSLQVFGQADGFFVGMPLRLYPGCGRNTSDCQNKFNNLSNYGGIPMLPGKSPFDGTTVF